MTTEQIKLAAEKAAKLVPCIMYEIETTDNEVIVYDRSFSSMYHPQYFYSIKCKHQFKVITRNGKNHVALFLKP